MTWQGVSEAECYDNRSVIAQIVRIKDRLTAVEQNVDPTLREDLTAAIAELTALENTVGNVETQVEANTGSIAQVQDNVDTLEGEVETALTTKADKTELTDGSVTKVGTADVGSATGPIYLAAGTPTACNDAFAKLYDSTTEEMNRGKSIRFGASGTAATPYVSLNKDTLMLNQTSSVKLKIGANSSNKPIIEFTPGAYYPCIDADRAAITARSLYVFRLVKGAMQSGKPWTISIGGSGSKSAYEVVIATPDGMARLAIYNTGSINSPPVVTVVYNGISGMTVVSSSNKTSNSSNTVYVGFSTQYAANSVVVQTENTYVFEESPTNPPGSGKASSVNYEDVVLDGVHIPNIANYDANYVWQTVI